MVPSEFFTWITSKRQIWWSQWGDLEWIALPVICPMVSKKTRVAVVTFARLELLSEIPVPHGRNIQAFIDNVRSETESPPASWEEAFNKHGANAWDRNWNSEEIRLRLYGIGKRREIILMIDPSKPDLIPTTSVNSCVQNIIIQLHTVSIVTAKAGAYSFQVTSIGQNGRIGFRPREIESGISIFSIHHTIYIDQIMLKVGV